MTLRPLLRVRPGSQRGAFGVLYAIMLPVMLGMIGLAVDLGIMYARGHELQSVAGGAALAAARALNGNTDGIAAAKTNAGRVALNSRYRFLNASPFVWSNDALSFASSPNGPWVAADAADSQASNLYYARVDTAGLDPIYGQVAVAFLRVVGASADQNLVRRAIAGCKDTALGPLAICALNNTELTVRTNAPASGVEGVVELGFRCGVTYNLLNLNPNGTSPTNFAMHPLDFAPAPAIAAHTSEASLRPFACSGKIPAPPLAVGSLAYVREPFPVALIAELNSGFGDYAGGSGCTKFGSPPDINILDYRAGYGSFWMAGTALPVRASAAEHLSGGRLATAADAVTLLLGIGRFLITTPATTSPAGIHAQFSGLTTYGALTANAVLYR